MLNSKFKYVFALLSTLFIIGCGGDDSSSSDSTFIATGVEASATINTGEKLADNLVTSIGGDALNSVKENEGSNTALATFTLGKSTLDVLKNAKSLSTNTLNSVSNIDTTYGCYTSGSYTLSGTYEYITSDTYVYNFTIEYNNCVDSSSSSNGIVTLSGEASTSTDSFTLAVSTDFITTDSYSNISATIYAGTSLAYDIDYSTWIMIFTSTIKMSLNGVTYASKDSRWVSSLTTGSMYQTKGREYINNATEWADYDTSYDMSQTPFTFSYYGDLTSGATRYTFSNGAKLKLTVISDNTVQIDLDTNADGTIDETSTKLLSSF